MRTSSKLVIVGMIVFVVAVLALGGDAEFFSDLMRTLTLFSRTPG